MSRNLGKTGFPGGDYRWPPTSGPNSPPVSTLAPHGAGRVVPSRPMTSGRPGDPAPPPRIGAGTSRPRRPSEQVANFPVAGRGEVLVPTAHRMERLGHPGTDDLVDLGAERGAGLGRGDRHGHDDP